MRENEKDKERKSKREREIKKCRACHCVQWKFTSQVRNCLSPWTCVSSLISEFNSVHFRFDKI
jgi:hypothetical protein